MTSESAKSATCFSIEAACNRQPTGPLKGLDRSTGTWSNDTIGFQWTITQLGERYLIPSSVAELVHHGHEVLIERGEWGYPQTASASRRYGRLRLLEAPCRAPRRLARRDAGRSPEA